EHEAGLLQLLDCIMEGQRHSPPPAGEGSSHRASRNVGTGMSPLSTPTKGDQLLAISFVGCRS
ncbi:hypothetical protein ABTK99_20075, partial [Acinetobacter baumannii]